MADLVVTPDGACFKSFRAADAGLSLDRVIGDRVEACVGGCGDPVLCPERASALLE